MKKTIRTLLLIACAIVFVIVYQDMKDVPIENLGVPAPLPVAERADSGNEEENEVGTGDTANENTAEENGQEDDNTDEEASDNQEDDGQAAINPSAGEYTEFSAEALESSLENGEKVVLFFHAKWCPTCGALDSDIVESNNNIPSNTTIFKVDYDTETELKEQFEITAQHTLVYLAPNGEVLATEKGTPTLDDIITDIANTY